MFGVASGLGFAAACMGGLGRIDPVPVSVGERAVLASGSFVMKGEEVPAGARWGGNPAREMPGVSSVAGAPGVAAGRTTARIGGRA